METIQVNGKPIKVYKKMPKGWKKSEGTLTQPLGTVWANNGQSLFTKDKNGKSLRKTALVITDEKLYQESKKKRNSKATAKKTTPAPKKPTAKKSTAKKAKK